MIFFITLFFIVFLVALISFLFSKGISIKELLCIAAIQLIVAGIASAVCYHSNTSDVEIHNGVVLDKKKVYTSCSHSYSCNCRQSCSGSGKNRSCHQVCDTCYDHSNDWDWTIYTSIGETDINRVDRRGSNEPPRFTSVKIGEPVSFQHSYTNYIKAAPGTLLKHQGLQEKYLKFIPKYPDNVYDYYRLNRLVGVNGAGVSDSALWNNKLSELNGRLGKVKQSNIIVVLVRDLNNDYFYALEEAWIGAKKNDVVLVIGVNSDNVPQWTEVMTWATDQIFKIKLRDAIMDLQKIEVDNVITALNDNVNLYYKRKPMAEFEYLTASITPTFGQWIWSIIISLILTICMLIYFNIHDPFENHYNYRPFR